MKYNILNEVTKEKIENDLTHLETYIKTKHKNLDIETLLKLTKIMRNMDIYSMLVCIKY